MRSLPRGVEMYYFPVATYKHTGLTLKNLVNLVGEHWEASKLDCTSATANGITLVANDGENLIQDLALQSSGASTGTAFIQSVDGGSGATTRRVRFTRVNGAHFKKFVNLQNILQCNFTSCYFTGPGKS